MKHKYKLHLTFLMIIGFCVFVSSCTMPIPKAALKLTPESLQDRQLQTRIYETTDEKNLLAASAALLQDLGYTLDESEVPLGIIVASRDRDVRNAGEIAASVFIAVLTGIPIPTSHRQKALVSLVTKPIDGNRVAVRITFQHMVWDKRNRLLKNEQINDAKIYQEFFSKLSKSIFLDAHNI